MADALESILNNLESGIAEAERGQADSPLAPHILNLSSDEPRKQEAALREIINATLQEENREIVCRRDGIAPIIKIVKAGSSNILRTLGAHALANLSLNRRCRQTIATEDGIAALVEGVTSHDESFQERSLAALCNLCAGEDELRNSARTHIVVPHVLRILSAAPPQSAISNAALMFIANVAINVRVAQEIVEAGGVAACGRYVDSNDANKRKHALFALAALSCNPVSHSQLEVFVQRLIRLLGEPLEKILEVKILTILVNISGHGPAAEEMLADDVIPQVVGRLDSNDRAEQVFALQIVQNLALTEKGRAAIAGAGGSDKVLRILRAADEEVAVHALRATTNLCVDARVRSSMRDQGAVDAVERIKASINDAAVKAAADQSLTNFRG